MSSALRIYTSQQSNLCNCYIDDHTIYLKYAFRYLEDLFMIDDILGFLGETKHARYIEDHGISRYINILDNMANISV